MDPRETWIARSSNPKTSDVLSLIVGASPSEAEATCQGCALRSVTVNGQTGTGCYWWGGQGSKGAKSAWKAHEREPSRYGFVRALAKRNRRSRSIRLGSGADPGALSAERLASIRDTATNHALSVLGYTHRWKRPDAQSPAHKDSLMASCETVADLDAAMRLGFKVALVVADDAAIPDRTPDGHRPVICPAIRTDGAIQCDACLLCDPRRNRRPIAFPVHGLDHVARYARAAIWQAYARLAGCEWR